MGWKKQPEGWRLSEGPLHLLINVVQWASGILTSLRLKRGRCCYHRLGVWIKWPRARTRVVFLALHTLCLKPQAKVPLVSPSRYFPHGTASARPRGAPSSAFVLPCN